MAIEIKSTAVKTSPALSSRLTRITLPVRRVSTKDRMFFLERLVLLLETGTSLHESLDNLAQQTDNAVLKKVIQQLREDISAGLPFSQAMAKHPRVFSKTYVNLVAASEQGGFMAQVLDELMKLEEKRTRLQATLQSALFYPAFLVLFSSFVVLFVLIFVFPKFGSLFTSIANELPITTRFLFNTSDVLRHYWIYIIGGLGGLLYLFKLWLDSSKGRGSVDKLKLKLPMVREIFAQLYVSQIMRVISLSLGHGVTLVDTLKACHEVIRNTVFRSFIERIESQVIEGQGIADAFQKTDFIPPLVQNMIATGEATGNLPLVTKRIADFYERELTRKLKLVSKIVEPMLLLIMGVMVGLIVSSLVLPIFKLSRVVH